MNETVAYTSDDCKVFAIALDHAWEIFLKAGRLVPGNLDTSKAALAYGILHAAARGERNPRRLAIAAVANADSLEIRVRLERSWRRSDTAA